MTLYGKYIFVPSYSSIHCLDIENEDLHSSLNGHYNTVNCTAFNASEQELFTGGNDRNILIWDGNRGRDEAYTEHLEEREGGRRPSKASKNIQQVTVDSWSSSDDE